MRRNPSSSRTRTDLDLRAPGALAALFARTRCEFGGARMELDTAAQPTDYLDRLNRAAGEHLAKIGEIVERAKADNDRELTADETAEVEQAQAAHEGLQPQIERWSKIREANVAHVERAAMAPAPAPITRVEVVERGAGHVADTDDGEPVFRSAGQAADAIIRARLRNDQAAAEQVNRAIAHQKTNALPGLLPIPTIGPLRGTIQSYRRIIPTATQLPLPASGLQIRRPKISQHTVVGRQGGVAATATLAQKQAAEKTDLPSQAMQIDFDTFDLSTFGGAVNMSIQSIERTDPGALDLVYSDLAQQYGIATEADMAAQLVAGATTVTPLAANADLPTLWKAVFAGAGTILQASNGRLPTDLYASVDQWARIGGATTPLAATNQVATAVPTELSAVLGNINIIVAPALPAGTLILGRRDALEYVENGQEPIRLSVPEPRLLGYEIAVYGYFASWVAVPGAFTVLKPA